MKFFHTLLICLFIISCNENKSQKENDLKHYKYELVENWPEEINKYNLGQPTGIGVGKGDNIFVFHRAGRIWIEPFPDSTITRNTILELDSKTGEIVNSWGANRFIMPHGLTVDKENNIWVTDVALHQIFKFRQNGKLLMKLGIEKTPGNDSLHFNLPTDIAVADDGSFYVSDGYGNSRIVKFSPSGKYIKEWGSYGTKTGQFDIPHAIAIDKNNIIHVADRQNNRVQLFDNSGKFIKELKNNIKVEQLPSVIIDTKNKILAIDYDPPSEMNSSESGSTIFELDSTQNTNFRIGISNSASRANSWFHDIAVDSKNNIYVGDIATSKVLKFRPVYSK